jgi:hypothetical protein
MVVSVTTRKDETMALPDDTRSADEKRAELHRIVDLLSTRQVAFLLSWIELALQAYPLYPDTEA